MPLIEWSRDLEINVQEVDGQHRKIVDIINNLSDTMGSAGKEKVVEDILGELAEYSKLHFSTEESLMEKHGYSGLEEQKKKHAEFTERVEELTSQYKVARGALRIVIMRFLQEWLRDHISGTDRKMGQFLQSKGIN